MVYFDVTLICQFIENVFRLFRTIPDPALIARNPTLETGSYWLHMIYVDPNS